MINIAQTKKGKNAGTSRSLMVAELRVQKDITDLQIPDNCNIEFPDANDLLSFKLTIQPNEGFYVGGSYSFYFKVGATYPYDPPKVKCETPIYHPNIDLEGNICLNILREDWKPIFTLSDVMYGLLHILYEPNPEDPLNKNAAELLLGNKKLFERQVQLTMRVGHTMK